METLCITFKTAHGHITLNNNLNRTAYVSDTINVERATLLGEPILRSYSVELMPYCDLDASTSNATSSITRRHELPQSDQEQVKHLLSQMLTRLHA